MTSGRPHPLYYRFAERLRRSRKKASMHAAGLSRAAGLDKNLVSLLEAGPGLPKLSTVEKLARVLGLSPGWLAFGLGDAAGLAGEELLCAGLAARARTTRLERGLSALGLAKQAGLTDGAVRSVESGRQPSLNTLEALSMALAVSPAWLAFAEGPRELPRRRARRIEQAGSPAYGMMPNTRHS